MDPLYAAGIIAAAYDLGLLHRAAPRVFSDDKGLDLRSAGIAGALGMAVGAHGSAHTAEQNERLRAALTELASLRTQERGVSIAREEQLSHALASIEQQRRALEIARWAAMASERARMSRDHA